MGKLILKVNGLHCKHCEGRVESALDKIAIKALADSKKGIVKINSDNVDINKIKAAIEELGYTVNE